MSHQPYEGFLYSDQELTLEESAALEDHLRSCESCSQMAYSWRTVESQILEAPTVAPEPNFVNRWQELYEADAMRVQRRQNRFMLLSTWGAAFLILAALIYLVLPLFQSPKVVVLTYLYQLLGLLSIVNFVQGFTAGISESISGGFPLVWLVIIAGVITQLAVLWVVSIRYLTNPRRVRL